LIFKDHVEWPILDPLNLNELLNLLKFIRDPADLWNPHNCQSHPNALSICCYEPIVINVNIDNVNLSKDLFTIDRFGLKIVECIHTIYFIRLSIWRIKYKKRTTYTIKYTWYILHIWSLKYVLFFQILKFIYCIIFLISINYRLKLSPPIKY